MATNQSTHEIKGYTVVIERPDGETTNEKFSARMFSPRGIIDLALVDVGMDPDTILLAVNRDNNAGWATHHFIDYLESCHIKSRKLQHHFVNSDVRRNSTHDVISITDEQSVIMYKLSF